MSGKGRKKKVVWNNSDCKAQSCLRPPGTSDWVQCDACTGWFHLLCLHLALNQLSDDKDFYCPTCQLEKQEEFDTITVTEGEKK